MLPQSTGATTSCCMWTLRKFRASENAWAFPCHPGIAPCSHVCLRNPKQKQDKPTTSPEKWKMTKCTSCYRFTWEQAFTVPLPLRESPGPTQAQLAEAGHQFPFACAILSRKKPKGMQAISFLLRLHLNAWFPGCSSCPSIDCSWRNEVEINHIPILNSFPPAKVFPGFPRHTSSFLPPNKDAQVELDDFLRVFMLSRPAEAWSKLQVAGGAGSPGTFTAHAQTASGHPRQWV